MKIFMVTDIEGVSGVVARPAATLGLDIINPEAAGRLLTQEVNATVEGLVAGGADEVVVWDGHGAGNSVNIEALHPAASLYQVGGLTAAMTILDPSYGAAVQVGTHAMMGSENAFLHHSFSSFSVVNMWLNGARIGEIGINAMLAAAVGIPTILVSGDRAACEEARRFLGDIATVETKRGVNRFSAVNRNPVHVREDLRRAAERAVRGRAASVVKRLPPPYELRVELMCPNQVEFYEKMGVEKAGVQTVVFRGNDFVDVWSQRQGWASGSHGRRYGGADRAAGQ